MNIPKELKYKLENSTDDESVKVFLKFMFDKNKDELGKELTLNLMQSSCDQFFKEQ